MEPMSVVTPSIRLVRRLGAGGMGSVWLAEHISLRTHVVVKFMAAELANSAEAIERFSREAAAAAQVKSPHVVQMLDHGVTPQGIPFIVMELLEGHDLGRELAARGRLTIPETAEIVVQVCKALSRAHERGIVHRDIKPDNIFLCDSSDGETFVKLLDFGIAKADGRLGGSGGTKTGAMIGTPYYMSPEQMVGAKTLDFRTDLWSLGVVAYECVVGKKPFDEETFGALAIRVHSGALPVPSSVEPSLPPGFDAWFATACARDLGARFPNAKELGAALARVATGANVASGPGVTRPVAPTPHPVAPSGAGGTLPLASGTDAGVGMASQVPRPPGVRGAAGWALAVVTALVVLAIGGALALHRFGATAPAYGKPAPSASASAVPNPAVPPVAPSAPSAPAEPPGASGNALEPEPAASRVALAPLAEAGSPQPPAPSKVKPAAAPTVAPTSARPASAPAAAPAAPANCNPPFFFDARGNRVFKPECL
jgi:serine/threonine-protein kinase